MNLGISREGLLDQGTESGVIGHAGSGVGKKRGRCKIIKKTNNKEEQGGEGRERKGERAEVGSSDLRLSRNFSNPQIFVA